MTVTTEPQTLNLDQIRIDGGTQPRVAIDEQVVAEYAELLAGGVTLPPVTVFFDGTAYWLADGFHRYWANKRIQCDYVFADVLQGTQRDAVLFSVGANAGHGLRRTNADKRKAVLTVLNDAEWSQWSNSEIARRCGVSEITIRRTREGLTSTMSKSEQQPRTYKTRHGTVAKMKTGNIGRHRSRGADSPNPIRQPRPALAQTNLNLPHDPAYGARAIVSAMGEAYARDLVTSLTTYLQDKKEGDA